MKFHRSFAALTLSLALGGICVAQDVQQTNVQDTKDTKKELKQDQKAEKSQAKADKAEQKALKTKQQKKADKAQDKANRQAAAVQTPQ